MKSLQNAYRFGRSLSWRTVKWECVRYLVGKRTCVLNAEIADGSLRVGSGGYVHGLRQSRRPMIECDGAYITLKDLSCDGGAAVETTDTLQIPSNTWIRGDGSKMTWSDVS